MKNFEKDEYFKIDVECHLFPKLTHLSYFPGMRASNKGIDGIYRALGLDPDEVKQLAPKGGWGGRSDPRDAFGVYGQIWH